ncbi:ABC transporter ATP-binding protein [Paenibacillus allorhizosphaerae]|uniref:Vitamin B12 import ATP-binding protein BtuD n=1 Tax=Paenibacillus allorhizosphaerae TaxID=2849866 RepID=A0ABM8VAP8_9BACL|nr:ABC transporter ATP-binding protein [Paenibacillus allorhizosphaerae]CAG7617029.1 Vitamin B12 import ATP-binding protein BtuD [Paenibacillus allorhizosphaerae]
MSSLAIEASELTKDYGNGRGCRGVTIQVKEGEAFGFLGPNGAGKSTFVKMLVGLIRPTGGSAALFGERVGTIEAKRLIGYLPELYRYQEWLTGEEVVRLHARLCGVKPPEAQRIIPRLLEEVGIGARGRDRVKHYSKGMQQRLGLACALVNDPKIVFLDEPSSALDPLGRSDVRQILQRLKAQGKTLFLNSHLLEDVEILCDRVALLNNGHVLHTGTVSDVLQEKTRWHFRVGGFTPLLLQWLREASALPVSQADLPVPDGSDTVWLAAELDNEEQAGWLNTLMIEQGITLYEVSKARTRLEEWFVSAVSGLSHRGERP